MLLTDLSPGAAATEGGSAGNPPSPFNDSVGPIDYPYSVAASLFPSASNATSIPNVTGVAVAAVPNALSAYSVLVASTNSSGNSSLWYEEATYSGENASQIATAGGCGTGCNQMPFGWSSPTRVASYSGPISSEALQWMGSTPVAAATSGSHTYLTAWNGSSNAWVPLGPVIPGLLRGIATTPQAVGVVSTSQGKVNITTIGSTGAVLGQGTIDPAGSGSSGVADAAISMTEQGTGEVENVVLTTRGSDLVEFANSTDSTDFSSPTVVGRFSASVPGSSPDSLGQTPEFGTGGIAGQVALASVGTQMFVLWTTNLSGRTMPFTESSDDNGTSWEGPFLPGPMNGTVLNPAVSIGQNGLVYATWEDPDDGGGAVDEAIYFPDGEPMLSPSSIPTSSGTGSAPAGAPALAVDELARPFILWPGSPPRNGTRPLEYSGQYLEPNASLGLLNHIVNDPLEPADFARPTGSPPPAEASLLSNVSAGVSDAEAALAAGRLCDAENVTGVELYQNLTRVPLAGAETGCGTALNPQGTASPLADALGVDVPNTYLAVYADWALESIGVPVASSPLTYATSAPSTGGGAPLRGPPSPVSGSTDAFFGPESVSVTPTPYSPTAYELDVSASLPGSRVVTGTRCGAPPDLQRYVYYYTVLTNQTWMNVSITDPSGQVVSEDQNGTSSYPTAVWPYDLEPNQTYSWNASFSERVYAQERLVDNCDDQSETVAQFKGWVPAILLGGEFSTTFSEIEPVDGLVTAHYNASNTGAQLGVQFLNTLPATDSTNITDFLPSGARSSWWNTTAYAIQDTGTAGYTSPAYFPVGSVLSVSVTGTSRPGSSVAPGAISLYLGGSAEVPAETSRVGCEFSLQNPTAAAPKLWTSTGGPYLQDSSTTARVTWYSNASYPGFFGYQEEGSALAPVDTILAPTRMSNGSYNYSLELHGLEPGLTLTGAFWSDWLSQGHGCLSSVTRSPPYTLTPAYVATMWETDEPYDSVSQEGGGANLTWQMPPDFEAVAPAPAFQSGAILVDDLDNSSQSLVLPITNLSALTIISSNGSTAYGATVTLTGMNSTYVAQLMLNFTSANGPLFVVSPRSPFIYEESSSGDGLTNVEKEEGWTLPVAPDTTPDGTPLPICSALTANESVVQACADDPATVVHASPSDDSTNGLVGDYVEKQFDLNPVTIDTMGSHMLDTWNLTFDLGPVTAKNSSPNPTRYLHYYYAESTYNFSQACQGFTPDPSPGQCAFSPILPTRTSPWTNLTWNRSEAHWMGDSNPLAAEVLWPRGDLTSLLTLVAGEGVGWLRAVTGTFDGDRTLTVWGKLSWGANPLAQSTSNDGLADGDQLDPLGPRVLQLDLVSWSVGDADSTFDGVAPRINVTSGNYGAGTVYYGGWGQSEWGADPETFAGSYVISVPIVSSSQWVYVGASLWENTGSATRPLNISRDWTFDLMTLKTEVNMTATYEGGVESLTLLATTFLDPGRANTLLVTPPNNTTLSGLPWGVDRYIGEPDFDLLELDAPTKTVVPGVEWAGTDRTYNVTLAPGLNDLLVPRSVFVNSPLGQALLNNTNESVTPADGTGLTFHPTDWSSRSQAGPADSVNSSNVSVFSTTNQSRNGSTSLAFGGVPGAPLDELGNESRELQAVLWVSLLAGGYGNLTSPVEQATDLFGGLLLNATGNVTGNLLNITDVVPSLGLPTNVRFALAQASLRNDGGYGAPAYHPPAPSPPSWWSAFASDVWNTLSGVLSEVDRVISVVWSATIAAAAYLGGAAAWLAGRLGLGWIAGYVVEGLKLIAAAMEWAINALWRFIESELFGELTRPVRDLQSVSQPNQGIVNALATAASSKSGASDPQAQSEAANGFALAWAPAFALGLAVTIASTILSAVTAVFGPVAPLLLGVVLILLGAGSGQRQGQMSATPGETVSTVLEASASFASSVVGSDLQEQDQVLVTLVGGSSLLATLVVGLLTQSNQAALGIAVTLAVMALTVAAYTPSNNVTVAGIQISWALILSGLALVFDLVSGYLEAVNWVAVGIIASIDGAAVYLAYKAV
jgi:hypothetical protein